MTQNNNEVRLYKAAAFVIFVIIVIIILAISIATAAKNVKSPQSTDVTEDTGMVQPIPDEPENILGTDAPITAPPQTEPQNADTTRPPITTKEPAVSPPTANVTEELAALFKKYPDTVLKETADAGQEYIDRLIFLGDSTTYGLKRYKMLSGGFDTTQVWTPKSGTLTLSTVSFSTIVYPETGEEITIKEAVIRKKPEYLVITLGVNGVSFMDESAFKAEYKGLVEMVKAESPNTKIICQSIFPVARSYSLLGSINNDKIRAANKWILEVAAETATKFADAYSVMCDSEGWLPEKHQNGDGLHPTPDAYTLELNNLRTHAYLD